MSDILSVADYKISVKTTEKQQQRFISYKLKLIKADETFHILIRGNFLCDVVSACEQVTSQVSSLKWNYTNRIKVSQIRDCVFMYL